MRNSIVRVLALLVVSSLLVASAHAADPTSDAVKIAREHFQRGRAAYEAERYEEALEDFRAGYLLAPRPEFLLNFVQTYRKLRRLDEAVNECERFLASSPRESRLLPEARALLDTLRREQLVTPPPSAPTDATVTKTDKVDSGKRRKKTIAIVLGTLGGLAVAGVAVGVGVALGTQSAALPSSMLGTHPFGLR